MESISMLALGDLVPHPQNPRFAPREEVVAQIATQLQQTQSFDPAHALIVRPLEDGRYQIIAGHHRVLAAARAQLTDVPCWVRTMTDADAYMALVLDNAQSELLPLEEGMHALGSGLPLKDYAAQTGQVYNTLIFRVHAARVLQTVNFNIKTEGMPTAWMALSAVHVAPEWLWEELVVKVLEDTLTVERTRELVRPLKNAEAPPDWADQREIAALVARGALRPREVDQFATLAEGCRARLTRNHDDKERFIALLAERLTAERPAHLSEVAGICNAIEDEQRALIQLRQQADMFRQQRDEQVRARTARLRHAVSLEEWGKLAEDEQHALLHLSTQDVTVGQFNKQENTAIEWAQFSYNPVSGCLHNCPYCYARDDATNPRMAKIYPYGFAPTLHPARLLMPRTMTVPPEALTDTRYKNVFTCSMADLFGRWVPAAWIEAVFAAMRAAPQWNFLCLTKFPKRLSEFALPANAWLGTTVDLQARVKSAEEAFAPITTGIRWLSIEPLLEPLRFTHLDRFDWMVIGGASKSSQTPEWRPPHAWIKDLERQADDAGVKVYYKTNLLGKRRLELPFGAILPDDTEGPAPVFQYLTTPGSTNGLE